MQESPQWKRPSLPHRSVSGARYPSRTLIVVATLSAIVGVVVGLGISHRFGEPSAPSVGRFQPTNATSPAKNLVLMIGDGMGFGTLSSVYYTPGGRTMSIVSMSRAGATGWLSTDCTDRTVTDSGAAATAMATGHKTKECYISVSPAGKPLETLLERCKSEGKLAGIIGTDRVTRATEAAFAAHHENRFAENDISRQMLAAGLDVLMGGGLRHWIPQSTRGSKREDDVDLIAEAKAKGYAVISNREQLKAYAGSGKLLGLFGGTNAQMAFEVEREGTDEPSLAEMTEAALAILSRGSKGFFLMVEGSKIDHANHLNEFEKSRAETLAFDRAVGIVLDFARRDEDTLVVVTADHDTGGMAVTGLKVPAGDDIAPHVKWASGDHTAIFVPLIAWGPHAQAFSGFHDIPELAGLMARALGIKRWPK